MQILEDAQHCDGIEVFGIGKVSSTPARLPDAITLVFGKHIPLDLFIGDAEVTLP